MAEFHEVRLGTLGKVVTGRTPPSGSPECFGDDYPFITPSEMVERQRRAGPGRALSEIGSERQKGVQLPADSVCVVCIGATIGKVCMTERPSFTNQQLNSIVVDRSRHDPHFVYYLCSTLRDMLRARAGGAATPIVNKSTFSEISVRVPFLTVERTIGAILSAYDDLIENNTKRIKILEEMARSLYREWFVELRFPGHAPSRQAALPKGWSRKNLFELASITYGFPFKSKLFALDPEGVPVVRIRDLVGGSSATYTTEGFDPKYAVLDGDLLIGMDGNFHMSKWSGGRAALNQRVVMIRPRAVSKYFLFLTLASPIQHLEATISGTTVAHLSDKDLRGIDLVVAAPEVQARFDAFVDSLFAQELVLKKKNARLREARDLLLPRLLSGEIELHP